MIKIICPFDCIFFENKLHGDCRIPWSKECVMNKQKDKKEEKGCEYHEIQSAISRQI